MSELLVVANRREVKVVDVVAEKVGMAATMVNLPVPEGRVGGSRSLVVELGMEAAEEGEEGELVDLAREGGPEEGVAGEGGAQAPRLAMGVTWQLNKPCMVSLLQLWNGCVDEKRLTSIGIT